MKWQVLPPIAAVLLATGVSAGEPPSLDGLRQVSDLGQVEFSSNGSGHVVGRYKGGGVCAFKPEEVVIEGDMDGSLFVGAVVLCQGGNGCPRTERYPFLAVFTETDMVGHVKVNEGCASPAISGGRLEVTEADVEPQQKEPGGAGVSASDVARRETGGQLEDEIAQHFQAAQAALDAGKYTEAKIGFQRIITANSTYSPAYLGLGVAQLHLRDPVRALENMQRALDHARAMQLSADYVAQVHYNRACALARLDRKRDAIGALRLALANGQFLDDVEKEKEFDNLRGEKGYKAALSEARSKHRNNR